MPRAVSHSCARTCVHLWFLSEAGGIALQAGLYGDAHAAVFNDLLRRVPETWAGRSEPELATSSAETAVLGVPSSVPNRRTRHDSNV
jgi:hypothetical protein